MPSEIGSARAKLVYLYLSTHGSATITELQTGLDMTKLTLYSVIRSLRSRGLIDRTGDEYALA